MTHKSGNPTWQDEPTETSPTSAAAFENIENAIDAGGSPWDAVSGGINYAGGKVGIGTTTPIGILAIHNSDGSDTLFGYSGTANYLRGSLFQIDATSTVFTQSVSISALGLNWLKLNTDQNNRVNVPRFNSSFAGAVLNFGQWIGEGASDPSFASIRVGDVEYMRIQSTGEIGIGTTTPAAALDVTSTTQGFLPPRMTTTQKNAISSPAEGTCVYDLTLHTLCFYNGTAWHSVA